MWVIDIHEGSTFGPYDKKIDAQKALISYLERAYGTSWGNRCPIKDMGYADTQDGTRIQIVKCEDLSEKSDKTGPMFMNDGDLEACPWAYINSGYHMCGLKEVTDDEID
jgi:hypothetical protein